MRELWWGEEEWVMFEVSVSAFPFCWNPKHLKNKMYQKTNNM